MRQKSAEGCDALVAIGRWVDEQWGGWVRVAAALAEGSGLLRRAGGM
ncbi:hypothetical protein AB0D60_18870 [Streptomyces sp. NPDC048306]